MANTLDWSTTPLAQDYDGKYAKILDDVFTPEECKALIDLATSPPPPSDNPHADLRDKPQWQQAAVHFGQGANDKTIDTNYRNSERILRFDHDAAKMIYDRLRPLVPELHEYTNEESSELADICPPVYDGDSRWTLIGVNERLSFLKYKPGHYFREHCDGGLDLPDGRRARVTIQIYLNGPKLDGTQPEGLPVLKAGGATRFLSPRTMEIYFDVEPKVGRVLIFQQNDLWHSGEDVTDGEKYALRTDFFQRRDPL